MAIANTTKTVVRRQKEEPFFDKIKNLDLKINLFNRISTKEIIIFTSQLSLMVEIGTPLNESLSTISRQIKNQELKKAVTEIIDEVEKGKLLSDALSAYPHIFSDVYVSLVKAGENTGQLKEMLERIVTVQEKQTKFVDMLKKAMTYPMILSFVSIAVIIFLLSFVFPRFASLFKDIEDILPAPTKFLIFLSSFIKSYWLPSALLMGAAVWGIYAFAKSTRGRMFFDTLKMHVPLMANIYIKIYLVQMMRTLGFLMNSNVPLLDALRITRRGINNGIFDRFIASISDNVKEGKGLALAFTEAAFIPDNARQVIKTGEETQNLPKVMLRLSEYFEDELDEQLKMFSTIIEPVLLIVMGIVVGGMVMSLILPIFKLSSMIH